MASSSSNPSSTSTSTSTSSSTTSTPSAARVPSTRARAPAASAARGGAAPRANASAPNFAPNATAPGVAPAAIASASAINVAPVVTAPGVVRRSIPPPPPNNKTAWGGSKGVPPPTYLARAHQRRGRGGRTRNPGGVSQHVSRKPSQEWAAGWQTAADPTSTFAPSRLSIEGSSSSASAWSSTPTDTRPAVATGADTAPEPDASTSSAPGVTTTADGAQEPDALTSASSSAPGVAKIVDAALEPDSSASASASATTSAPGSGPTIPSLRDNWVAIHWGIVQPCHGQQAFRGNAMPPPVEGLYRDPLCPWREQVPPPRSFGFPLCWVCRDRPARVEARPCGHLAICVRCYCYCCCYANSNRFVCPLCFLPIKWLLCW